MKASKAIALAGLAVLAVVSFRYGLKVATDSLLVGDREPAPALAEAPAEAPRKLLAPATATPSMPESEDSRETAAPGGDRPFGAPDPEFGKANPAQGEPAWGAAERARQAAAAAAEAAAVPET